MTNHPFYQPNYSLCYNGYEHDVSFLLSCDGLVDAPGWRLAMFGPGRYGLIEESLEFIGLLYGPRYCPKWETTDDGYKRLTFDAIELKYRSFRRRYLDLVTDAKREELVDRGFSTTWLVSPTTSFREIWHLFYSDVADAAVHFNFINAVLLVVDEIAGAR